MEYIDAANLKSRDLNNLIVEKLAKGSEVEILNPHSMHNIATGLTVKGKITVKGSTGFYVGGFMETPTVVIDGNTGWYAGDNMMGGELLVTKNTGCNAGAYFYGGTMVVYGGTGSRAGYGMKGGTIIVCGSSGRWAGQMTLGGKLILLGKVGKQVGESMYKGVIFVRDEEVADKLGGNVFLDSITAAETLELKALFEKYEIKAEAEVFKAIRPSLTGRHKYTLFAPDTSKQSEKKIKV